MFINLFNVFNVVGFRLVLWEKYRLILRRRDDDEECDSLSYT
jgi:hypothetical protein